MLPAGEDAVFLNTTFCPPQHLKNVRSKYQIIEIMDEFYKYSKKFNLATTHKEDLIGGLGKLYYKIGKCNLQCKD